MPDAEPLNRPIWHALETWQAAVALGAGAARRFHPDYGVFAACVDDSPTALSALADLVRDHGPVALLQHGHRPVPPGLAVARWGSGDQMIAGTLSEAPPIEGEIVPLGETDAAEMLALATLTEPGPFFARTHQLGTFFGIRRGGELAAMAGERMKLPGYTEISGVCTHPAHRGHGYAAALTGHVANAIAARGETPFLHVVSDNRAASRVYEALGFVLRRRVVMTLLMAD
jgi:predicted GNAT family acetyltransferase